MARTSLRLTAAVAAFAASAAPAAAQSWQTIETPGNTAWTEAAPARAFWNNRSNDGAGCNIGFIATNAPATSSCGSQRPGGWLPRQGAPMTHVLENGNAPTSVVFSRGTYSFTQAGRLGGDVAGANTAWGLFELTGGTRTIVPGLTPANVATGPVTLTLANDWGFWIDLASLNNAATTQRVYSDDAAFLRHFALFTNVGTLGAGSPISAPNFTPFVMGMEDIGCTATANIATACRNADFDNNDVVVTFAPVPEPSTYALMASGLALMGVVARRRRTA
mgnify:CR=1 FL=1